MVRSDDRLVCRIQRQLDRDTVTGRSRRIAPPDHAELVARIDRLCGLGDEFDGVRLSRFVVQSRSTGRSAPMGGECVTTEV